MSEVQESVFHEDVSPETCLRIQDQMMIDWLSKVRCRNQYAKVLTGWGSRQFRETTQVHNNKPVRQAIPLPMMTLTNVAWKPDSTRWTRCPVRMSAPGTTSRENTRYLKDAALYSENAYGPDGLGVHPDGVTKVFTGFATANGSIRPGTVTVAFIQNGSTFTETDDGHGWLTNTSKRIVSSYVKYDTGDFNVTFTVPPDNHTAITIQYATLISDDRSTSVHAAFPLPVTISYQVDIWTKTKQDMRALLTGILSRFEVHPETFWVTVEFPIYGTKQLYVDITGATDTSDLETEEEERELRHTVNLDLHGWIFREPYTVKTISSVHAVFIAAGGGPPPNCDLDDEAFTDWYSDPAHYHLNADGSRILSIDESPVYAPPSRVVLTLTWDEGTLVVGP